MNYFCSAGLKSLRTLSTSQKRSPSDTEDNNRPSKRKKVHHKIRADRKDIASRSESLRSHMAVKNTHADGEECRAFCIENTEKVVDFFEKQGRKVTADNKDNARRRESLRSRTAVKNSEGEGCGVFDCAQDFRKEAREDEKKKLQTTLYESDEQSLNQFHTLEYPEEAAKLLTGLQELNKHLEEINAIFQKCKELIDFVKRTETREGELKGEKEGDIVIKMAPPSCEILDVIMGDAENEGRNRNSAVGFVGNNIFDHKVIEIFSDSDDGGEQNDFKCHGGGYHGQRISLSMRSWKASTSGEVDRTHCHKEKVSGHEIVIISSDDEGGADSPVVISSDDEVGANGTKVLDMNHGVNESHSEEHTDRNLELALHIRERASSSHVEVSMEPMVCKPDGNQLALQIGERATSSHVEEVPMETTVCKPDGTQLALQIVGSATSSHVEVVPMEAMVRKPDGNQLALQIQETATSSHVEGVPIVCTPLACMQKFGPWSTRIRKDGKRWRRGRLGWTHIKRKYLLYQRLGETRLGKVDTNLQSLLKKGRQKEDSGFPADIPDDEDCPYEAYRRNSQMAESDLDEDELEDLFQEMALELDKGGRRETTQIVLSNEGGCSHDYALHDEVGWVCEKCGLVGQDIQSIFLQDSTPRLKKKAAIVPVEEEELDPEIQNDQGLYFAQGALPRVTLTLHPYYEEHLHPHQKEGITFLTRNLLGDAKIKLPPGGCILAHAPGTGKSCLTVSFVQSFLTAYPNGRPLIVAPKIMLKPWQNEFEQWNVDDIPVYDLNEKSSAEGKRKSGCRERDELARVITSTPYYRERLEDRRLRCIKKWLETRSVLVVSYNLFATLVLAGFNDVNKGSVKQQICQALLDGPELLVLDEGHFPRSKRTKISKALMRVRTNRKILLSGTLFQNNFSELFNLMKLARHNFMSLCPEFAKELEKKNRNKQPSSDGDNHFAGRTENELDATRRDCEEQMFMEEIGVRLKEFVEGAENFEDINLALTKLRALTGPIVHWYTGQILESLPGLCEFVVYLNLTARQRKLQSRLKCKSVFEEKTRLAELCIHPKLLKENLEEDLTAGSLTITSSRKPDATYVQHDPYKGVKTGFVFDLLRLCRISGERLLIFCQNLSPLTLIESMIANKYGWSRGKEILRLEGKIPSDERQTMIEQFNDRRSQACVMLASINACKEGISLVGASRVIILDVLYNPSVVRQAVSRAFRIGQKKRVHVYRLVAADTKEEKIFQAAVQKDWLSRVLIDPSLRTPGNRYGAEKILQVDNAPEDRFLQKILHTEGNGIDRICRYQSGFS